ncbi:MAG: hypothetical protein N2517_03010 [Ignavibacteria bacterium]|nr:hypothetical protein [Ignavibacteria bacterium]
MINTILLWVLSALLMFGFATYQRLTGPTYPINGSVLIQGEKIDFSLLRSWGEGTDAKIEIKTRNPNLYGYYEYRRFKSYDDWTTKDMLRANGKLIAYIPKQPPAGKVMYSIFLKDANGNEYKLTKEPVIIRFKGDVPPYFLIPHVAFMFFAFVTGLRTFFEVVFKRNNVFRLTLWTFVLFLVGGAILGPIIQYYAFGAFWTGFPFGHDLTDNKTLVSLFFWGLALWKIRKNPANNKWALIASIVMIVAYLIPHSLLGSELDYTKME